MCCRVLWSLRLPVLRGELPGAGGGGISCIGRAASPAWHCVHVLAFFPLAWVPVQFARLFSDRMLLGCSALKSVTWRFGAHPSALRSPFHLPRLPGIAHSTGVHLFPLSVVLRLVWRVGTVG